MLTVDPEHLRGRLIHRAVETLKTGGVIVYPTDTVYGLGCDITNKAAIERIQRLKGRDAKKPMSFVCADVADISTYAHVSKFAFRLLQRLLPGPFTFILPATKETPRVLRSKQRTVGVRIPDHPVSRAIVSELGHPLLSTSANRSAEDVLTDPVELESELGPQVDLILECGILPVQPSTVVSLIDDEIQVLRQGKGDISAFIEDA
ncbi:MAG: threonylcarbamoyl-AMP synthase [Gemmatimonadetes bacterium]|nr:threonylcarbamoyl-AMP synthase [Gemmatimonadota bacterium]MBT6147388.1 threonylcarbamoyl-AMP synthase [Gemmatimonadota bacterium]MBT7863652.1 threonylcarbamoyl-AMP synthase [Gemmatimonadota bacterium]